MNFAITTIDNPFDPFEQFDKWFAFDIEKGYKTTELLSSFARTSIELSDELNDKILSDAIDEIVELFGGQFYKKVERKQAA